MAGVLAFYCIVHLQQSDLVAAFSEMYRVLEECGVLLLSFHAGTDPILVESFLDSGAPLEFSLFEVRDVVSALERSGWDAPES